MKRGFLFISLLCLLLTSCASEFWKEPDNSFIDAKFTLVINDKYTTRSQSGNVDVVTCAVYDASGNELDFNQTVQIQENKAIYSVKLPNWQNYRIVFFAYKSNSSGGSDYYDLSDLKSITIKTADSNIEEREAFCGYLNLEAEDNTNITSFSQPVALDRINAQLNFGIDKDEYDSAQDAGTKVAKTKIKVSNVYKKFSAYENMPVGSPSDMVFEFNDVPSGKLVDNDLEYHYLSMNYLLAGSSSDNIYKTNVEFSWISDDGTASSSPICFTEIPIYKNCRTNVIGKLITNPDIYKISFGEKVENLQGQ